ncbi:hypothetical protein FRB98_003904, partial [Tulasnella sp. 332]
AGFFFSRDQADQTDGRCVLSTIAAVYSIHNFHSRLVQAIQADLDARNSNPEIQLIKLILDPLQEVADSSSPVAIRVGWTRRVSVISNFTILHANEESIVKEDIRLNLRACLQIADDIATDNEVKRLVEMAQSLFIVASTAVGFISCSLYKSGKEQPGVLLSIYETDKLTKEMEMARMDSLEAEAGKSGPPPYLALDEATCWLEILSLLGGLEDLSSSLTLAEQGILRMGHSFEDSLAIIKDAERFVRSVVNIYFSALPFTPGYRLNDTYAFKLDGFVIVQRGCKTGREPSLRAKQMGSSVDSVTFSPSGHCLAFGLQDRTIKLWDSRNVAEVVTLNAHPNFVNSFTFSPNGDCLASRFEDSSVCLWDAQVHAQITKLEGHTNGINSVASSSNWDCLASGSWGRNCTAV